MKKDKGKTPADVQKKNEINDINVSVKLKFKAQTLLAEKETLEEYIQSLARAYRDAGLSKENLFYDLLHVWKEKVRSEYIYEPKTYRDKLKQIFDSTSPKKGIFEPQMSEALQELLEYKNRNIETILNLSNKKMSLTRKKQRISHILTARFIDKFRPRTLARSNDNRMYYYEKGVYREGGRKKIKEFVVSNVGEDFANKILGLTREKVEAHSFLWREEEEEFFHTNDTHLCLENGVFNLETFELEEHSPQKVFFEKLPVKYDLNEKYEEIEDFIRGLVEKEKDVRTIQEIFGYCLKRNYKYKKAFIFLGDKNNGKSTVLNILIELLGTRNVSNVTLQDLGKRFQKRWIVNKLANIVADIPSSKITETADFKGLTGQDMMMYEVKGGGAYNFRNYAKLIYSANDLPGVENPTDAFFTRWVLVEFPYTFISKEKYAEKENNGQDMSKYKIKDPDALDSFWEKQSKSGLLNWALKGLQRLEKYESFSQKDEVKQKWIAQTNSFKSFALQYLENGSSEYVYQEHLDEIYTQWCNENNLTIVSDRNEWKKTLENMFKVAKQRKRVDGERKYIYRGVKFREQYEQKILDLEASFKKPLDDEEDIGYTFDAQGVREWFNDQEKAVVDELLFVDEFSEQFLDKMKTRGVVHRDSPGKIRI